MMAQGAGVRLSVLVGLVSVAAAVGCASRGDGAGREGSTDNRVASDGLGSAADRGSEPERVVQRMAPAMDRAGLPSGAMGAGVTSGERARNGVASGALENARTSRANAAESIAAESISPKHLEAELNRLEAEIGN